MLLCVLKYADGIFHNDLHLFFGLPPWSKFGADLSEKH